MFANKVLIKGLVVLICLVLFGLLFNFILSTTEFNQAWIDAKVKNQGSTGIFYFILLCMVTTACGLPRQVAAFLGGYAFGVVNGIILATLGATLGCVLSFYFARILARSFVIKKFPKKINSINRFLHQSAFTKTIIIRLLPVGSNLITNLVVGVTHAKGSHFIAGSFIGYLPQMIIFSLAGSGVEVLSFWKIGLSVLLFIISTLLSVRLYYQYKMDKKTRESLTT
ncbi:MAG: VTT domain-containing protein [Methyloprofundus sp.]|nr:VTT domain-containing protein [Methyloprofundus sp.]MBW6453251.1 VTT domain-containing protein [Methyloprofundus sp.]